MKNRDKFSDRKKIKMATKTTTGSAKKTTGKEIHCPNCQNIMQYSPAVEREVLTLDGLKLWKIPAELICKCCRYIISEKNIRKKIALNYELITCPRCRGYGDITVAYKDEEYELFNPTLTSRKKTVRDEFVTKTDLHEILEQFKKEMNTGEEGTNGSKHQ